MVAFEFFFLDYDLTVTQICSFKRYSPFANLVWNYQTSHEIPPLQILRRNTFLSNMSTVEKGQLNIWEKNLRFHMLVCIWPLLLTETQSLNNDS
jgi:hypothetical protein